MFSMPQELATTIQNYASIVTILAAFVSAGAGFLTFIASSNLSRYSDEAISKANSVSAQANSAAATANEKAEEINKQNLELQIKLEKERKERLELQKAVERRSISKETEAAIRKSSERINRKLRIRIECHAHDHEALAYAEQFGGLLHSLGHDVEGIGTGIVIEMGTANIGVYLLIYDTPAQLDSLMLLGLTGFTTQLKQLKVTHEAGIDALVRVMAKPPYIG